MVYIILIRQYIGKIVSNHKTITKYWQTFNMIQEKIQSKHI